ncbi:hypothetical protein [Sandarakinorhabdus rubra]|uniref:hypothetical protein n=1 Tax=Sandarakinorhabdus rubra TaxID=2672568 RepID=UPI0013DCE24C|nr:hypothetical protein [Sandarakinorhabdus rubra]
MRYQYLRLFLVSQDRPGLLEALGELPPELSRQAYLEQVFGQRIDFTHRKTGFVYVSVGATPLEDGSIVVGRIGRSFVEIVNGPPEAGFQEAEINGWRASNILLDTRQHEDGQKIAMQDRGDVGSPLPVLQSLVAHINAMNPDSGWRIEISVVSNPADFWEAVRRHKNEITAAAFEFVTPNILRLRSSLNESLKGAREDNNAHRVDVVLRNENGLLKLEEPNIVDAIDYVSKGGGTAKLKKGKKIIYDSEQEVLAVDLDEDEVMSTDRPSLWAKFGAILFK